jgi:ATP-dependent DNA ligase
VASAAVPFLFITSPACQRHITREATEEIKLDGYRAIEIKSGSKVYLLSRNENDFTTRYSGISAGLDPLPDETVRGG